MVKPISEWLYPDAFDIDEFFLKKATYKELYEDTDCSHEQLSPKGLALLSYLYAQKDGLERQPVIASTGAAFSHVIKLIATASEGTQITVIFQATDESPEYALHKTTCKLERRKNDVLIINMDSTINKHYPDFCESITRATLNEMNLSYQFYRIAMASSKEIQKKRQLDWYQCGVFATKDARQLNRDKNLSAQLTFRQDLPGTFDLPVNYLKSIQSSSYRKDALLKHGNEIINRANMTLAEIYDKYSEPEAYARHFSTKYYNTVRAFLNEHRDNPHRVRECTAMYDAGSLMPERLALIYGPDLSPVLTPLISDILQKDVLHPKLK